MPTSQTQMAKRALVAVLVAVAGAYRLRLGVSRDSPDAAVKAATRRVLLRVHPDKGGELEDAQRVILARDKWEEARQTRGGRPPSEAGSGTANRGASLAERMRECIQRKGAMTGR